ncbi:MAG: type II toxin-antitoxin system RelE family toxin [Deltaproteobacteria bacterium]
MNVLIDKSFAKDIDKINDKRVLHSLAKLIESIKKAENLSSIQNCKKLRGTKNAYRIRSGDYRIGFLLIDQNIELVRFLHRSEIYIFFPD